jgi:hypothetical protein
MHNQDGHSAPAEFQQPLLDGPPAFGVVVADDGGKARQVVEDKQVGLSECRIKLSLDFGRGKVADAALFDQIASQNF